MASLAEVTMIGSRWEVRRVASCAKTPIFVSVLVQCSGYLTAMQVFHYLPRTRSLLIFHFEGSTSVEIVNYAVIGRRRGVEQ